MSGGPSTAVRMGTVDGRRVLAATILASGMAGLDMTVVNVALPRIGRDLHAGFTSLQWVVNAYALTLSSLLLLGGALGDRLGRRRLLVVGTVWFAAASVGCAVAPSSGVLIGMRGLQGIGAALLMPGSLAILESVFVVEDRGAAVGAWSGLGGVATALGPVLGGWLVQSASWRWVFIINAPLAVVVVWLARGIPETEVDPRGATGLDALGAALAAIGLGGAVFGLTEGPARHWPALDVALLVAGVLVLAAFVWREAHHEDPLVPLDLFNNRQFSATNLVTFIVYAALSGALFLLPLVLQRVSGFSPVKAGSSLLPVTAVMLVLSARAGRLAQRIGPRLPMTVGPIVVGGGLLLETRIGAHASYLTDVLPALLVFALGLSLTVAPLTATVLGAAPDRLAGVASAINNDVARTAGLVAVAVLPAIAGISTAAALPAATLAHGFRVAMTVSAGLCALGGVVSLLTVTDPLHAHEPPTPEPTRCPVSQPGG
ncbi:MAG TPA: MFS transporter [Mycobacteriales bacterium]|nr:MFS transporter [Mycobacteriales bacterium]